MATPLHGDVVIRTQAVEGITSYVLSVAPGRPQLLERTLKNAMARAIGFAEYQGVCAWVTDGTNATLIKDCRTHGSPRSVPAPTGHLYTESRSSAFRD